MTGFFHSGPEPYSHYLQNEAEYVFVVGTGFELLIIYPLVASRGVVASPCKMGSVEQTAWTVWTVPMPRNLSSESVP
jgi:hypothetical protein